MEENEKNNNMEHMTTSTKIVLLYITYENCCFLLMQLIGLFPNPVAVSHELLS